MRLALSFGLILVSVVLQVSGATLNAVEEADNAFNRTRRSCCCSIGCTSRDCCISSCCYEAFGGLQPTELCTGHYFFVKDKMNWMEAQNYCLSIGTSLLTIECMEEYLAVLAYMKLIGMDCPWIGLNCIARPGCYVWPNGCFLGLNDWATGQPETADGFCCTTMCLPNQLGKQGWFSNLCTDRNSFICAVPAKCYTKCCS